MRKQSGKRFRFYRFMLILKLKGHADSLINTVDTEGRHATVSETWAVRGTIEATVSCNQSSFVSLKPLEAHSNKQSDGNRRSHNHYRSSNSELGAHRVPDPDYFVESDIWPGHWDLHLNPR